MSITDPALVNHRTVAVLRPGDPRLRYGFSSTRRHGWYLMVITGDRGRFDGPFPTEEAARLHVAANP